MIPAKTSSTQYGINVLLDLYNLFDKYFSSLELALRLLYPTKAFLFEYPGSCGHEIIINRYILVKLLVD